MKKGLLFTDIEAVNEPVWVRRTRRELKVCSRQLRNVICPGERYSLMIKISTLRSRLEAGGYELTRESN